MKHFALLCAFLFAISTYGADSFKGSIVNTSPRPQIRLDSGALKVLFSSTPELMDDIHRLQVNDIIHFQGSSDEERIDVTIIEYIELHYLRGPWQSENWDYFNFTNDRVQIHSNPFYTIDSMKYYAFSIFPGKGEFWTILLSNGRENRVGQVKVSEKHTLIEIFNFESKDIQEHFDLTRIH